MSGNKERKGQRTHEDTMVELNGRGVLKDVPPPHVAEIFLSSVERRHELSDGRC